MPEKQLPIADFRGVLKKITVADDVTITIVTRWRDELIPLMPLQGSAFRFDSSVIEFTPDPPQPSYQQEAIQGYEPPPPPPPKPKRDDGKTLDELFGRPPWSGDTSPKPDGDQA